MHKTGRLAAWALVWLGLAIFTVLASGAAWAQGELIQVDAHGPVDVRADVVEYDEVANAYLVSGEVEISRGGTRIFADKVNLNAETLIAEAEGNVRITSPDQVLTGERIVVDMQNGTGKVYHGQIFVAASHYYLKAEEIEKVGKDTYRMHYGSFTTCDGSDPDWTLTGEEMEVTIEGYGTAKNAALRAKDIPLLWTPWVMFPAKFKRQSGLLIPQLGQSNRDGFVYSQPYFQTIGEDQDATFTMNYMSRRGFDLGLEYRYNLSPGSKGMIMTDYMPHDDRGEDLYESGENAKPYNSRYWVRAMADQKLFNDTMDLKIDLDLVSDEDYLREFVFGYTGYDSSNQRFIDWFGRDLDPNTSLTRESKVNLLRTWSNATFNGNLLYYDDLATDNKSTLQQLPYLTFDATSQPVGDTGLYFQMGSSYNYYYREEGSTGQIADVSPSISLPLNFNDYLEIEPQFTYKPRLFSVTLDDNEDPEHNKTGINQLWDFSTSASTYLYRTMDFGTAADPFKIKHALIPNITYAFQPKVEDEDDANLARRGQSRVNVFAYGIDNRFTSKVMGKDPDTGEITPLYREFMRFNLDHSFDLSQYRRGDIPGEDNHYWGNVDARLEFDPTDYIYLEADTSWNLYNSRFESLNFQAMAENTRGDAIELDYRQTHGGVHQLSSRLKGAITKEWSLNYINRHDFVDERDFESTYEVRYEGQCWGVRIFYTETIRERGYYIAFSLGGFGELFGYGKSEQAGE